MGAEIRNYVLINLAKLLKHEISFTCTFFQTDDDDTINANKNVFYANLIVKLDGLPQINHTETFPRLATSLLNAIKG